MAAAVIRCLALVLALAASLGAQRRPNVVVILADDLGYECLTCNGGGSYETPNLDRLAAGGARFTNAHVQPLCTPTRVQVMTGQYNVRNYVGFGQLKRGEVTFGNLLRDAGYKTGICGKWQLGRVAELPKEFGFDEHVLWQHTRFAPRYPNPGLEHQSKQVDYADGEYGPDLISDFAVDFVERHRDEPFLLYYPMILPHFPHQATPDSDGWDPAIKGENKNKDDRYFADMVRYMDKLVGRLVDKLDQLELRDDTLVLFVGDNGTFRSLRSEFGDQTIQGMKGRTTCYGTHVPMIASWPGKIAPTVVDDLADSTDILQTVCDVAGVEVPDALPLDGHSLWPRLQGKRASPREWIYCWYSPRGEPLKEFAYDARFKLYRSGELFDYRADPLEQTALAAGGAASAARIRLQAALDRYSDARPNGLAWPKKNSGDTRPATPEKKR